MPATTVRCSAPSDTVSFRSFFDFGTGSAATTSATRSSTFPKSSMLMREPAAPAQRLTDLPRRLGQERLQQDAETPQGLGRVVQGAQPLPPRDVAGGTRPGGRRVDVPVHGADE